MLTLSGISKSFGDLRALDDVTFTVLPGRLTGFVGRNGAGKTTAMRIVLGVLAGDAGTVTLHGSPVGAADRRRFGYMPEERGLYPKMKVLDQVAYLARLHGFGKRDALDRAAAVLARLGLAERTGDLVETLSLGNQQRAQIAAALVHDPNVLILDEPFSGLDPFAVELVAGVLQERAAAGAAVLFSSHQLDLVERLCDDLVIISDGRIRAAGDRETLRNDYSSDSYELVLADGRDAGWIATQPGVTGVRLTGSRAVFEAVDPDTAQRVLRRAVADAEVAGFGRVRPTLGQIFKEVVS